MRAGYEGAHHQQGEQALAARRAEAKKDLINPPLHSLRSSFSITNEATALNSDSLFAPEGTLSEGLHRSRTCR